MNAITYDQNKKVVITKHLNNSCKKKENATITYARKEKQNRNATIE